MPVIIPHRQALACQDRTETQASQRHDDRLRNKTRLFGFRCMNAMCGEVTTKGEIGQRRPSGIAKHCRPRTTTEKGTVSSVLEAQERKQTCSFNHGRACAKPPQSSLSRAVFIPCQDLVPMTESDRCATSSPAHPKDSQWGLWSRP